MTKINLEYFGMPGSGATVKEAKLDAGKRIEEALSGSYAPVVLAHRGEMLVMFRDAKYGWGYRIIHELQTHQNVPHCSTGFSGREDCLLAAVKHLADNTRVAGETDSPLFDALDSREASRVRREVAQEWPRRDEADARYKEAIARGMGDWEARSYAWRDPARRELWETVAA